MTAPDPKTALRVLAIEPWLGGSHRAFLENLRDTSTHRIEICGLAARHWKWRMRAGAWELARDLAERARPDVLLVSDFLDLPAFLGFAPPGWSNIPTVAYFHENQLTYPAHPTENRIDSSFGFTNILTCVRADRVLFNSRFHRESFAAAARELLHQLPRPRPLEQFETALAGSEVIAPGVDLAAIGVGPGNSDGPLRVLFPHRWEHDKDPLAFLNVMRELRARGLAFELVLLGEQFERAPAGVPEALESLRSHIAHAGYLPSRADYSACLQRCDVVVSTARHEFFGIAVVEAMSAGAEPLLPDRLSYPEVLGDNLATCKYATPAELLERLASLAQAPLSLRNATRRAQIHERAQLGCRGHTTPRLDRALASLVEGPRPG